MDNTVISPRFSLLKSLPSFGAILTGVIIIFLVWAFFSKESYRFYASFLFLFYSLSSSMWISVIFLGIFQTFLLIPFRIINLTRSKHIRDFEKKVNEVEQESEQGFLIKRSAKSGHRIFLYYIVDFFVQLTSYVSIGRLFLTDFYSVKLPTEMLYSFVPYPEYPLQDTWFKIPYLRIAETQDLGMGAVLLSWVIIFILSMLAVMVIRLIKNQKGFQLSQTPASVRGFASLLTGSSILLMIVSFFLLRNFPIDINMAIFTGDIGVPNHTFNTITALATFFTILWLDIPSILKKGELARKAGINKSIIHRTLSQLFGESLRSATVVGLGAYFITNHIPCAFELSIFTLEIVAWLSPLTLDRIILRGEPRYEAPITLDIQNDPATS